MKNRIFALIMAIVCLSLVFTGCSKEACEKHTDDNLDAKCDVCEADVCGAHKDADADLTCDVCTTVLKSCEAHLDEVVDNVCDACRVEIPVKCELHKDDNADKICDACGGAIVVLTEQIAPIVGERVPMTVNPIPQVSDFGTYIITKEEAEKAITELGESLSYVNAFGKYVLFEKTDSSVSGKVFKIYNVVDGQEIYTVTEKNSEGSKFYDVEIYLYQHYFVVLKTTTECYRFDGSEVDLNSEDNSRYDTTAEIARSLELYVYSEDAAVVNVFWTPEAETPWEELTAGLVESYANYNGIDYVKINGLIWAFDSVSSELIQKNMDPLSLIYRPAFDQICDGKYGYIELDGKIFVYDLTKWIECIYSYEIPEYYESTSWFVLQSGNLLLQGMRCLPYDAISYDFIEQDAKYDLVYTMIDPTAQTATNVEFGYFIEYITVPEDSALFTEAVKNVAVVRKIADDRISALPVQLVLNNDLTVAGDLSAVTEYGFIADGLFLKEEYLGGEVSQRYIVDVNGKKAVYVPYDAYIADNCIFYDGAVYNFKMEKLLTLEDVYAVEYRAEDYMILSSYNEETAASELYYYNMKDTTVAKLDFQEENDFSITYFDYGYQISYTAAAGEGEAAETVYVFYNFNNEVVEGIDRRVLEITEMGEMTFIRFADLSLAIAK